MEFIIIAMLLLVASAFITAFAQFNSVLIQAFVSVVTWLSYVTMVFNSSLVIDTPNWVMLYIVCFGLFFAAQLIAVWVKLRRLKMKKAH